MTQRLAGKLSFVRKLLLGAIVVAAIAGPVVFGLVYAPQIRAQSSPTANVVKSSTGSQAENAGPKAPAYEVISIKPFKVGRYSWFKYTPDGLSAEAVFLAVLIRSAYANWMPDQLSGWPGGWVDSARFDIQAKMDEETAAALQKLPQRQQASQRQLMLQSLLADRFKLRVHHEMKILPIYELVIAKRGFKLKESHATERKEIMPGQFTTHAMPIADFVSTLADYVGSTIVDKTGLTGKYDFTLNWALGEQEGPILPGADGSLPQGYSGPTIFEALQEQLGLKLVPTKGPVDTIVIDHIERPSEN